MNTQIVPIAAEHIEGFHRALDSVARERRYLVFLEAPSLEQTREFILHNIANNHPQFVAILEGRVIGWCDILPKRRPVFSHSGILGMGIVSEFRGKGIGTSLIEATLKKAWEQNLVRIELTVFTDNKPAIHLYEKIGFCVEGELRDDIFVDGRYKNSLMMAIVDRSHAAL